MACAILERTSGFLKLVTVPNFCPFTIAIDTVCHQFGLLRTDLHLIPCAGFLSRLSNRALVPALPQLEQLYHRQTADW